MNRTPVMNDEARKEYAGAPVLDVGAGEAKAAAVKKVIDEKAYAAKYAKKKPAAKAKAKK